MTKERGPSKLFTCKRPINVKKSIWKIEKYRGRPKVNPTHLFWIFPGVTHEWCDVYCQRMQLIRWPVNSKRSGSTLQIRWFYIVFDHLFCLSFGFVLDSHWDIKIYQTRCIFEFQNIRGNCIRGSAFTNNNTRRTTSG